MFCWVKRPRNQPGTETQRSRNEPPYCTCGPLGPRGPTSVAASAATTGAAPGPATPGWAAGGGAPGAAASGADGGEAGAGAPAPADARPLTRLAADAAATARTNSFVFDKHRRDRLDMDPLPPSS